MNLEKYENETQWEYGLRLIENKVDRELDLDWDEIVDLLELNVHKDSLRKASSVTPYSGVAVAKYYKDKIEKILIEQGYQTDNMQGLINELEQKKLEIMKETVKMQDQRRQYHSLVRTEARWEKLFDMMREEIERLPKLNHNNHTHYFYTEEEVSQASLLISDWHLGSNIKTYHNTFNVDIAKERIAKLKDDTIKYCNLHKVRKLHVNIQGDLISGNIHVTTRLNNQEDVVEQVVICSELLSNLVNELSNHIKDIEVHYTIGNHGRVSPNIKESLDSENFEYLILEFLKLRLKDNYNVKFDKDKIDKEIVVYNVFDKVVACVHGHREKRVFDSVMTLSMFLGMKIDMVVLGHFHNFAVRNNVVVNGCLSGSDEYANNLRFNNEPSQTLIIHFKDGGKALYEINLN